MNNDAAPVSQNPFPIHRPDWNFWKTERSIKLWHAVALACDLDPYQFTAFGNHQLDRLFARPGRQFDDLLMRAMSSVGNGGILKPISISDEGMEESAVSPSNFGAWLKSIRYAVPAEFPWLDEAVLPLSRDWPWGSYETKLLRDLANAANRFWRNYDPSDKTTAPRGKDVANWLIEQGVTARTAEIMATILRADGLPTGPR